MKKRKGFRSLGIDKRKFLYALSFYPRETRNKEGDLERSLYPILYFYDETDHRHELNLMDFKFPEDFKHSGWRGKNGDCAWGSKEVAHVIKTALKLKSERP